MASSKIFPFTYHTKDLPNSLRIVVVPLPFPNIVSLQIPVAVGSRNEVEPGKSGFAHFFEHCMFRGSTNISAPEYNKIVTQAGADQNAYTTDDYTNYHITFIKEDLETFIRIEADRFINLSYSQEDFKTESCAIVGEYNKTYSDPLSKLHEVQRDNAYVTHTYKHTTMGFIKDIEDMPNCFEYSRTFFDRFYRPNRTSVIVVGDVVAEEVFKLVEKYWGTWKPKEHLDNIPQEIGVKSVYSHIVWDTDTTPILTVGFHGPKYSTSENDLDNSSMDIIAQLAFSSSSALYTKLVIEEQVVIKLSTYFPDRTDPYLVTVIAHVKDKNKIWYVRDQILETIAQLRCRAVPRTKLQAVVSNLRYSTANDWDNAESIAEAVVSSMWHARDPEGLNKKFALLEKVTPEIIQNVANKYFTDERLVVVTLSKENLPESENPKGSVNSIVSKLNTQLHDVKTIVQKSESPVISIRFVFRSGSALDGNKPGLASLTANIVTKGGSTSMKYDDIQKALFPTAAKFDAQVDKEMTTFICKVNKDALGLFYELALEQLFNPAWSAEDFSRVKDELLDQIKVDLRGNNDEELAKEILQEKIFTGHPYGSLNLGHVGSLEKLTLDDVKEFYKKHYTIDALTLGVAGNIPDEYLKKLNQNISRAFSQNNPSRKFGSLSPVAPINGIHVTIAKKETRATAISFGYPIEVTRSHPDFAALWLARSYLGEHRSYVGVLMNRMREIRGLNYGDYAYNEYFPNGMFQFQPDPNLGRLHQIFEIWIRPVPPECAHFAIRLAKFELDKLTRDGISEENFILTRSFLLKFINVLVKTQDSQLGYTIDSEFYGIPEFIPFLKAELMKLTAEKVNSVVKKHLNRGDNFHIAIVTKDAEQLCEKLVSGNPSPMNYDSPKSDEIQAEDKIVEVYPLPIVKENVQIVPLENIFQ